MKPEYIKYIQENIGKKSIEEIAKDLNLKARKIKKILEKHPVQKPQKIKLDLQAIPSIDICDKSNKLIKTLLAIILLLAVVVRLIYLIQLQGNPLPSSVIKWEAFDQYRFMQLVNEFVEGNWLGSQVTRYSPVYSYLMAVLYKIVVPDINTVFVFQMLLGLIAVYVFYETASLLFNNKKAGLIAAFLAAFYSPFIFYEGCILRASVVAYSNLLMFYFLLKAIRENRSKYFFIAGVVAGISMVMRPSVLPFFIVPYIIIAVKRTYKHRIIYILLFISALMLVISPLAIRNRILGKSTLISFQGPSSFWIGNTYDSTGIGLPRKKLRNELANEGQGKLGKTLTILWREIRLHPREYRNLYLLKLKMFFNGYEIPANLSYDLFRKNHSILRICFINFSIICPLAILGIFIIMGKYRHVKLLYLFFFVLSFSVIAFHIQGRYRLPAVPFIMIFSSYTIYWFAHMIREKKFFAFCFAFIALIAISFYTKPDHEIIKEHFGSRIRNVDYANLAHAYVMKAGEEGIQKEKSDELLRKASNNLVEAMRTVPVGYRTPYLLQLGKVYYDLRQYNDAKDVFSRILVLEPNNEIARRYINSIAER